MFIKLETDTDIYRNIYTHIGKHIHLGYIYEQLKGFMCYIRKYITHIEGNEC